MIHKILLDDTRVAFYARYSSDLQRETSIEDQLRRCREIAEKQGFSASNSLTFTDEALSGGSKHTHRREGYQKLLDAMDAGECDVIITDELSRLTRDVVDQAHLIRRFEDNRRVRLITNCGVDTAQPNWQLQAGLAGLVNQQSTRDTQHRVRRGMLGQLERGYMLASPPFGYDRKREYDQAGNPIGTNWCINEQKAEVVREVFARREAGESMYQIARWLNNTGVKTSRAPKTIDGGYWRASRVKDLLSNSIYRGEFRWHSSNAYRNQAVKHGIEVEEKSFPRPHLRIVSDETWYRCAEKRISRSGYGGGKHALAGLLTCGRCGGTLVLTSKSRCRSAYCGSCSSSRQSQEASEIMSPSVAVVGVEHLLVEALKLFCTSEFLDVFRDSLRQKLDGDHSGEIEKLKTQLRQHANAQRRISHLLVSDQGDDPILEARYQEIRETIVQTQAQLHQIVAGHSRLDAASVEAQLLVDPRQIVERLFSVELPAEKLRALLTRLFPEIVLIGKDSRYISNFKVSFAPGAALAMGSETQIVDDTTFEVVFQLRYRPDPRPNAATWDLMVIDEIKSPLKSHRPGVPEGTDCRSEVPLAA